MRRRIVVRGLLSALAGGLCVSRSRSAAAADTAALAQKLAALVVDPDPAAVDAIARHVRAGLPPGALAALLDAIRRHPRPALATVVARLARYRRPTIRARAFAAWVELGPHHALAAISAAADDLERGIRRLAYALAQRHTSPAVDAVIAGMLARDPELAQELQEGQGLVPGEPT